VTSAATPNTYAALTGATMVGAGIMGANGSGSSTTTVTYTAQTQYVMNLSGNNDFTVGLLNMGSYGTGFDGLTFSIMDGGTVVFTKTFATLASAQTFFTDDPLAPSGLQNLTGSVDLTLSYALTASDGKGAGFSYVIGDTVSPVPEPSTWALLGVGLGGLLVMRRLQRGTLYRTFC
jgi:hypothetical protein